MGRMPTETLVKSRRCPKYQCGSSKKRCGEPLRLVRGEKRSKLFCDLEGCGFVCSFPTALLEREVTNGSR